MNYIATFYSHFGAIRYKKICQNRGWTAQVMPVPRDLSSSCGTCVRYDGDAVCPEEQIPEEVEQIMEVSESGYICRYLAQDG